MSGPDQATREYDDMAQEVLALLHDNKTDDALAAIGRLAAIDAERPESLFLLGLTALLMDETGRALEYFEKAAAADPECFEYAEALANLYAQAGRLTEGLYFAKLSTTLMPHPTIDGLLPLQFSNFFVSMKNTKPSMNYAKGVVAYRQRKLVDCLRDFERELKINPDHGECLRDYGDALAELGRYSQALHYLTRATQFIPNDPDLRFKLGNLCYHLGEFEEAVLQHKAALRHDPESIELAAAIMARSSCLPGGYEREISEIRAALQSRLANAPALPPEAVVDGDDDTDPSRKIRVAYLADRATFGDQSRLLASLLQLHNRQQFEVDLYLQSMGSDSTTQRLRSFADTTRYVGDLDDELFSVIVCGDGVDILVDLCGGDHFNRATLLHMHPAKHQVGVWGGGMGLSMPGIDAVLTDDITDPAAQAELGKDQTTAKFDYGLVSYPPREIMPQVNALPALQNNNAPVIGIACDAAAILGPQAELISEILTRVPKATVLAGARPFIDPEIFNRIKARFHENNLSSRIGMSNHQQYADQLIVDPAYWQSIDVYIDVGRQANPANIADALWMGVPVLALMGDRPFDRQGVSAVYAAAKTQWIAETPVELVDKAVSLLSDIPTLAEIRSGLRDEMRRSLLFNPEPFVRSVERTYQGLMGRDASNAS